MKTRYILSILTATAIFAGCAKENASENIPELGENQFFATIEDGAKTLLNRATGDNYNKIFWEEGDIVNINGSHYTVDPLEEDPRRALFTLADGEPAPTKLPYMAYYPYQLGGLVLPSGYSYVKENPFRGVFPMFAISSGSRNLMFKNICGLLEISLTGTDTITRLTVSDENLPLSGKYAVDDDANAIITEGTGGITIDCGEDGVVLSDTPTVFYVPVPKGTYKKLTVSAISEGGEEWKASTVRVATVERNKIYTLNITPFVDYEFRLTDEADAIKFFTNTDTEADVTIPVTSNYYPDGSPQEADWLIKSVKVGSSAAQEIGAASFVNIDGLSATKDGSNLKLTSAVRVPVSTGSHAYWTGGNGLWSPEDWSSKETTDLSTFNFQTETTGNLMTTANCYVIRHAGTYKIPLVYGNGVVNGVENTQSYFPDATGGENRLGRFVNHLGEGIFSAFIENNDGCMASSTAIIWQDKATVIKDVSIDGDVADRYDASNVRYLRFTVDNNTVCQNNAIIAVKDADGKIVWSWHIWTTNDPALLSAPISVTNFTNVEYKFFPVYNLGWIDAVNYLAKEDVKIVLAQKKSGKEVEITVKRNAVIGLSNGCWYQFGRKDPMPTADVDGFYPNVSGGATLSDAIQNPGTFYNAVSNDWLLGTRYYNLWTGKLSVAGKLDKSDQMIKTVYDPSPAGYKLPASNAFSGFTTTGDKTNNSDEFNVEGGFNSGWYFYTKPNKEGDVIFFPAAGCRGQGSGTIFNVGDSGDYLSAVPNSENYSFYLYFDNSDKATIHPFNYKQRSYGFSARPVREE